MGVPDQGKAFLKEGDYGRFLVDNALLNAGIIPERFRRPPDWRATTGWGGVYETQDGYIRVVCEVRGCPNSFLYRSVKESPVAGLQKVLDGKGWGFHDHYVEDQASPVVRLLYCPEHIE